MRISHKENLSSNNSTMAFSSENCLAGLILSDSLPLDHPKAVIITRAAARVSLGMDEPLLLGNLDAKRDWGHAREYVEGMCEFEL